MTIEAMKRGAVLLLLGLAAACSHAGAKTVYTTFSVPNAENTYPVSINSNGDVTGAWTNLAQASSFLRTADGTLTLFDIEGSYGSAAMGINDKRQIAGYYFTDRQNKVHGFLREPDGSFTTFDVPESNGSVTIATAIDGKGTIYGLFMSPQNVNRIFLRRADGTFTAYDAPGAGKGSLNGTWPMAINRRGDLVGYYQGDDGSTGAYLRKADGTSVKVNPPGAKAASAIGVDDAGNVTGGFRDASGNAHGFIRWADGTYDVVDAPNASGTTVNGGNGKGKMWGAYLDNNGLHGFILHRNGALKSFDVRGSAQGTTDPSGMNRDGMITGEFHDANGQQVGFIRQKAE